jgi:DNA-binding beta-propeller fold protein YncE
MFGPRTFRRLLAVAIGAGAAPLEASANWLSTPLFERVHTYYVPDGSTAEIGASNLSGTLFAYSDSDGSVGFLDLRPLPGGGPIPLTSLPLEGEPTSVVFTPDSRFVLAVVKGGGPGNRVAIIPVPSILAGTPSVAREIALPGEPDSIATSLTGRYVAIAIENELSPTIPGELAIIDAKQPWNPAGWTLRSVDLRGFATINPDDPEPEFVDVRGNLAAVTLQENNHVALVDLPTGTVVRHFSAGTVTHRADIRNNANAQFTDMITDSPRIPDGIGWTLFGHLVTANEGEGNLTGGRGVSVFDPSGAVLYDTAEQLEVAASGVGHYPDARSGAKGTEMEGLEIGLFGLSELAIAASERGNFLSVHRIGFDGRLSLAQILPLPVGAAPEGVVAIPLRGLLVSTNEGNATITFFARTRTPDAPAIVSTPDPASPTGDPIWWSALSGFSAGAGDTVYAVPDSAVAPSRIFTLETGSVPGVISSVTPVTNGGAAAAFDLEGIAVRRDASGAPDPALGFWAVSEGNGAALADKLIRIDATGAVQGEIVELPAPVKAQALRWGLEGVAVTGSGPDEQVYVAFQREWLDDAPGRVRIGRYTPASGAWVFFHYLLETPSTSTTALQTGLSDLVALDAETFLVIERDSLSDEDAALKRIYSVSTAGVEPTPCDPLASSCAVGAGSAVTGKTLVRDLLTSDGLALEKIEGLAIRTSDGALIVANDNDGVGETRLLRLP